jgi:hypothetical protein
MMSRTIREISGKKKPRIVHRFKLRLRLRAMPRQMNANATPIAR